MEAFRNNQLPLSRARALPHPSLPRVVSQGMESGRDTGDAFGSRPSDALALSSEAPIDAADLSEDTVRVCARADTQTLFSLSRSLAPPLSPALPALPRTLPSCLRPSNAASLL
jgi:hypothetical protein